MNVIKQTPNLLILQNRRQVILLAFYLAFFIPAIVVGLYFYIIFLERLEEPLVDAIGQLGILLLLVLVWIVAFVLQYLRITSFTSSSQSSTSKTRQLVQIGINIVESLATLMGQGLIWILIGHMGRVILFIGGMIGAVIVWLFFLLFFPYITCILDRESSQVTIKRRGLLRTTIIEHSLDEVLNVKDIDPLRGITSIVLILESGQELSLLPFGFYMTGSCATKQETVEIVRQFLLSRATS